MQIFLKNFVFYSQKSLFISLSREKGMMFFHLENQKVLIKYIHNKLQMITSFILKFVTKFYLLQH